jgi:hypothetical protein
MLFGAATLVSVHTPVSAGVRRSQSLYDAQQKDDIDAAVIPSQGRRLRGRAEVCPEGCPEDRQGHLSQYGSWTITCGRASRG